MKTLLVLIIMLVCSGDCDAQRGRKKQPTATTGAETVIHTGKRGGRYIIDVNGKKKYLKRNYKPMPKTNAGDSTKKPSN